MKNKNQLLSMKFLYDYDFETIYFNSLVYTNLPYYIREYRDLSEDYKTPEEEYNRFFNENLTSAEYNEFQNVIKQEIEKNKLNPFEPLQKLYEHDYIHFIKEGKFSKKLQNKLNNMVFPNNLDHYYRKDSNPGGYFIFTEFSRFNSFGRTLITFLNDDFNDFDTFFEYFTGFFVTFYPMINNVNIDYNKFYTYDFIYDIAKANHKKLAKRIIKIQNDFKNFIDYIFLQGDYNEKDSKLTIPQRFYIYYLKNKKILDNYAKDFIADDLFSFITMPFSSKINPDINDLIARFTSNDLKVDLRHHINTNSLFTVLYISLYSIVCTFSTENLASHSFDKIIIIRKCKNCGKYFKCPLTSTQRYCDNLFNERQTCKDIGNQIAQLKKQKYDLVYGKYRKIYSKKAMLVKRNPDIKSYKTEYENWKKEAQEYRDKLKKEEITNEEFEKWLDNNK